MADNEFVRSAHKKVPMTEDQMREFAKCADPVTGYKYFMEHYFYIQHPMKGQMLYEPFEFQSRMIANFNESRYSISIISRQCGKTTSAGGYLLWYAMFIPDSTILIAAHQYTGAQEIMQRIRYAYELCPMWLKAGVEVYNQGNIDFDNKSRIVARATTEKTGRGMSLTVLYLDEFAFVRPTIAREFWTAISPTLATGGKCIITSTPNSDDDQFANIWKQANKKIDEFGNEQKVGINGFSPFFATWREHPERDEKWASEERAKIGEERFRREHDLEFILDSETLISSLVLATMEGKEPIEKQGQVRWYKKPQKDKTYLVSLDPAMGTGGDNAAIQVFEMPNLVQVAEWQHNKTRIQQQVSIMAEIIQYLADTVSQTNVYFSVENNSLGEAAIVAINEYGEEKINGTFLSESGQRYRKGFTTTNKSKVSACAKLKQLVENNKITINSNNLIGEFKTFIAKGASFAAVQGSTDDLVMSTILIIRMAQLLQRYDQSVDDFMKDTAEEFVMPMPFIVF